MKKIPTVFVRQYENHDVVKCTEEFTSPETEEAFLLGTPTIKWDGSCCAVIDGKFYKRYDAKRGKKPPEGAVPCGDPDPVTGHWPHWVLVDPDSPGDKWFVQACEASGGLGHLSPGTYEAVGKHFNNNPYRLEIDYLVKHGNTPVELERSYGGVRDFLEETPIEGVVFWYKGSPAAKIKRSDFKIEWPTDVGEYVPPYIS